MASHFMLAKTVRTLGMKIAWMPGRSGAGRTSCTAWLHLREVVVERM